MLFRGIDPLGFFEEEAPARRQIIAPEDISNASAANFAKSGNLEDFSATPSRPEAVFGPVVLLWVAVRAARR